MNGVVRHDRPAAARIAFADRFEIRPFADQFDTDRTEHPIRPATASGESTVSHFRTRVRASSMRSAAWVLVVFMRERYTRSATLQTFSCKAPAPGPYSPRRPLRARESAAVRTSAMEQAARVAGGSAADRLRERDREKKRRRRERRGVAPKTIGDRVEWERLNPAPYVPRVCVVRMA